MMPDVFFGVVMLQADLQGGGNSVIALSMTIPVAFVVLATFAMFFVFGYLRRQQGKSVRDGIEKQIKEHEQELLLLAEKRKAERSRQREQKKSDAAEEDARSKVSVDATRFFGKDCAMCLLPMLDDEEIVVCADDDAAFHLVCARNNKGCLRQGCDSFVYVHPTGEVKRWRDLVRK